MNARSATGIAVLLALVLSAPLAAHSKVPDSLIKKREEGPGKSIYGAVKKDLREKGYGKGVFGTDMSYIAPGFSLPEGLSVYVAPVENDVKGDGQNLVAALAEVMRAKVVRLLKESDMFSRVSDSDAKGADLIVNVKVLELQEILGIWLSGSSCIWQADVRDAGGRLVMSGFDKLSSEYFNKNTEFLTDEIPIHTILFICRHNPEFDAEYMKALRNKRLIWFRR